MNPNLERRATDRTDRTDRSDRSDRSDRWIFYDADCAWCRGLIRRWGPWLRRAGYEALPLQLPGTAERLGVTPTELMASMHLLTADGRRYAGADVLVEVARARPWTRPLAWIAAMPGVMPILRRAYAAVAARRHCLSGTCPVRTPGQTIRRVRVFLELP